MIHDAKYENKTSIWILYLYIIIKYNMYAKQKNLKILLEYYKEKYL